MKPPRSEKFSLGGCDPEHISIQQQVFAFLSAAVQAQHSHAVLPPGVNMYDDPGLTVVGMEFIAGVRLEYGYLLVHFKWVSIDIWHFSPPRVFSFEFVDKTLFYRTLFLLYNKNEKIAKVESPLQKVVEININQV